MSANTPAWKLFTDEILSMLSEGVPTEDIVRKINESWERDPDAPRLHFFMEHLRVVYENVVEGSEIPEDVLAVDDDAPGREPGVYRRMRDSDRIIRAGIERLEEEIRRLVEGT